jgi:hypothetical protein
VHMALLLTITATMRKVKVCKNHNTMILCLRVPHTSRAIRHSLQLVLRSRHPLVSEPEEKKLRYYRLEDNTPSYNSHSIGIVKLSFLCNKTRVPLLFNRSTLLWTSHRILLLIAELWRCKLRKIDCKMRVMSFYSSTLLQKIACQ